MWHQSSQRSAFPFRIGVIRYFPKKKHTIRIKWIDYHYHHVVFLILFSPFKMVSCNTVVGGGFRQCSVSSELPIRLDRTAPCETVAIHPPLHHPPTQSMNFMIFPDFQLMTIMFPNLAIPGHDLGIHFLKFGSSKLVTKFLY